MDTEHLPGPLSFKSEPILSRGPEMLDTMAPSANLPPFLRLPLENTQYVISFTSYADFASLSRTCHALYDATYGSGRYLWKALFLQLWDDPRIRLSMSLNSGKDSVIYSRLTGAAVDYDWKKELQRRIWAANLIRNKSRAAMATCAERKDVLNALLSVLHTALPAGLSNTEDESKNGKWVRTVLGSANALNHFIWPSLPRQTDLEIYASEETPDLKEYEICSQLHTYIGLTEGDVPTSARNPDSESSDSSDEEVELEEAQVGLSPGISDSFNTIFHSPWYDILRPYSRRALPLLGTISTNLRTVARAFVYDLSNYTPANKYAPLLRDLQGGHKAYWKHLEQLMVDILWNLRQDLPLVASLPGETTEQMKKRCSPPMDIDALRPWSAPGFKEQMLAAARWEATRDKSPGALEEGSPDDTTWNDWDDWAGVEGTWHRAVCFMDYRDFARYNWATHPHRRNASRNVSVFEEQDFTEATRFLSMDIRITSIERNPPGTKPLSAAAIRLNRPRIYFAGRSRGDVPYTMHQEQSRMTGWVECLASEDVRWHMVSSYAGEERWSSESIQIGGVGSARGAIGTWTGVDHDPTDPVGPSWFWKVSGRESLPPLATGAGS